MVIFAPEASEELALAATWYEARAVGLGERFADEAERLAWHLVDAPRAHPRATGSAGRRGVRRARIPSFPYSLLYLPLDVGEVRVIAVVHHRRGGITRLGQRLRQS